MKKHVLLITISLFIQLYVSAQSQLCLPDGIMFTTQAEVDSFQNNYPGCTAIEGDVIIGINISNLEGLSVLTAINGDLVIRPNNELLTSLQGLDGISTIGGNLHIESVRHLTALTGLENIDSIGGDLSIIGNNILVSIAALNNLCYIGGNLKIMFSLYLPNLQGLNNLNAVGGGVYIYYCSALLNLSELSNLNSIGSDLSLMENRMMHNLNGLDSLLSIGGELYLRFNFYLNDISAINNLKAATIENLEISYNNHLSTCHVKSICDYLAMSDNAVFFSNETGCNSRSEVEEACIVNVLNISSNPDFLIYPSPATNMLHVSVLKENESETHELVIYDLYGRKVEETVVPSGATTIQYNVSGWSGGLYTAIATYKGKITGRAKFVVL